jgi:hypothetical protein
MTRRSNRAPYRGRRPLPAIVLLLVLAVVSVVVWTNVLRHTENSTAQSVCPASPTTPAKLPALTPLPYTALDGVQPVPPGEVRVHTLNASTQRGLAVRVSLELAQYGVAQAAPPGNDPRYPTGDMRCFGQIRFGPNGSAAARTLSLLVPCAQLVRDNRQDTTVDLALGSYFTDMAPSSDATQVLAQLAQWSRGHPATSNGGLQSQAALPSLSPALLNGAHTWRC